MVLCDTYLFDRKQNKTKQNTILIYIRLLPSSQQNTLIRFPSQKCNFLLFFMFFLFFFLLLPNKAYHIIYPPIFISSNLCCYTRIVGPLIFQIFQSKHENRVLHQLNWWNNQIKHEYTRSFLKVFRHFEYIKNSVVLLRNNLKTNPTTP